MIAKFVIRSGVGLLFALGLNLGWVLPSTTALAQAETPPTKVPVDGPTATPTARHKLGEQTVTGGSFVLRANETIEGDLVVLGGSATLETGARVEGDINVAGGSADIGGTVTGDVNVLGGSIKLRSSAVVEGGTQVLGGSIDREEGATVRQSGNVIDLKVDTPAGQIDIGKRIGREISAEMARANAAKNKSNTTFENDNGSANSDGDDWQSAWAIISTTFFVATLILLVLVSISVVTLIPDKTNRMLAAARGEWLISGGIGLLSIIALSILIALFTVTLCLIPLAGVLGLTLIAGMLIGMAVIARYVGERLMIGLGKSGWTGPKIAAVGAVALALIAVIPVLNFLIYLALTSIGLGALVLTRFGTRPYPYLNQLPPAHD